MTNNFLSFPPTAERRHDSDKLRDVIDTFREGLETLESVKSPELAEFSKSFSERMRKMTKELEAKQGQIHVSESSFNTGIFCNSIFNLGRA